MWTERGASGGGGGGAEVRASSPLTAAPHKHPVESWSRHPRRSVATDTVHDMNYCCAVVYGQTPARSASLGKDQQLYCTHR